MIILRPTDTPSSHNRSWNTQCGRIQPTVPRESVLLRQGSNRHRGRRQRPNSLPPPQLSPVQKRLLSRYHWPHSGSNTSSKTWRRRIHIRVKRRLGLRMRVRLLLMRWKKQGNGLSRGGARRRSHISGRKKSGRKEKRCQW